MRATILIVDEEPVAATTLAAVFEKSGYRVFRASAAGPALARFEAQPVDVVIMDDQLEGAQRLGRHLKGLRPAVPVVVFSSVPLYPQASSYADLFVPKPENPRLLLQRVAALIEESRSERASEGSDAGLPRAA